ncbi:MAG: hypothetical protein MUE49_01700 [Rhodospirillales bacterium]|nr:hypothetical protein [Rhodospirillales bacterium]
MTEWLGASPAVFIGVTVVLVGFCAYMTGQAIANTWRPIWQMLVYCALLAAAARFLSYGLFGAPLLSITGYLSSLLVLWSIGLVAFRFARARKMVTQYPWIYQRTGPFGWRSRH